MLHITHVTYTLIRTCIWRKSKHKVLVLNRLSVNQPWFTSTNELSKTFDNFVTWQNKTFDTFITSPYLTWYIYINSKSKYVSCA